MLMRATPLLFVLLWSTGFIGSKLGSADAEPFTFLSLRFALVLVILVPVALFAGRQAGNWIARGHAATAGALIHGIYLGGVLWALRHGMPAGIAALIVSLQPILTSLLSGPLLGERLAPRHWMGLALGLAGAVLVLAPKLETAMNSSSGITPMTVGASLLALSGITAGTLYQKRFASGVNLVSGAIWQYIGALAVSGPAALLFETRHVNWTPQFIFALAWLVIVLSIGAISLLMLLIRQNTASSVSGLFYLVPAVTALLACGLFGETLDAVQMAGLALATVAVLLISGASKRPARA